MFAASDSVHGAELEPKVEPRLVEEQKAELKSAVSALQKTEPKPAALAQIGCWEEQSVSSARYLTPIGYVCKKNKWYHQPDFARHS